MPLHVFDPADVHAIVKPDSSAQHTPRDTADAVTNIHFGTDLDAVVTVDQRDVFDGVVSALEMERPGVGMNVVDLLVGVVDAQPLDRCRVSHLEQSGRIFFVPAASRQNHGADQRFYMCAS